MQKTGSTEQGFAGTLKNVQLADFLQMWCLGGNNTAIRVTKDSRVGTIYLVDGEIVHAKAGDIVGEEAFYTVMRWSSGAFESIVTSLPEESTISQGWQYLLMESSRRIDEDKEAADEAGTKAIELKDSGSPAHDQQADKPIRVLIVDDSAMMRKALAAALGDGFIVVGNAANGAEALELVPQVNPDVITMDVNMPVMDGISALKRIMIQYPIPTIMVSAVTQEGATVTFDALKYGAVDFISKPSQMDTGDRDAQISDIRERVRLASRVAINAVRYIRTRSKENTTKLANPGLEFVGAMGAGEGGYGSLLKIIPQLDPELPAAFIVVLYVAPAHVEAFSRYLDQHSRFSVKQAKDGEQLRGGTCYLASGEEYVTIKTVDGKSALQITPSSFPARRGSANMLMISLAEKMGPQAVGMVLSGTSTAGAEGVGEISHMGGTVLIQAPSTCLMHEMPKAALATCVNALEVDDNEMAREINRLVRAQIACDPAL